MCQKWAQTKTKQCSIKAHFMANFSSTSPLFTNGYINILLTLSNWQLTLSTLSILLVTLGLANSPNK